MKKAAIILGVLLSLILILAVISPNDFILERTTVISKPKDKVFSELKFLKNHEKWNAWSKKDPKMKKEFKGTDGAPGFISSWESEHEEVGTAEQEILNITEGQKIETQIRFKKPFTANFMSYIILESSGENSTKVLLGMSDKMKFPMTVISFIVNVCLGNQNKIISNMDESLKNLKTLLESE
ncbi:MAG TPA: SRPBCC family protein [Leptospiraceae bacterium]|nr:SRPBCC family protein [Leptospiraceae bacterium]HNH09967.1 SRPBCC family protein [Leptospiraceae bacterium]